MESRVSGAVYTVNNPLSNEQVRTNYVFKLYMFCLTHLFILTTLLELSTSAVSYAGGIPVPGRSVPVLRLFENYASSCTPSNSKNFGMDQLSEIMRSLNAEEVAQKVYNALFFSMADVNIEQLMGTWYTVVDTKAVHPADCTVTQMELVTQTEFTATFTVVQRSTVKKQTVLTQGFGTMVGPDPGELFVNTGHQNDHCPYLPVKLGGITASSTYDYIILSQPLKFPTIVLTRNAETFNRKYKNEVNQFLEKYGFLSPIAALNTRLTFINNTDCLVEYNPY